MSHDSILRVIENIMLDYRGGPMYFQVQVMECVNFEVLLGCPFFMLTLCRTFDLPSGEQDILLTDPNTHKEMRIPTLPWVRNCQVVVHGAPCGKAMHMHLHVNITKVEGQDS